MNNLFIMHTQYNLILSAAVISRSNADTNTLVLWSEFSLTEQMSNALNQLFDQVIVVSDCYVSNKMPLKATAFIRKCVKKTRTLQNMNFDRIFMSQERTFDLIICEMVKRNNPKAIGIDIEEDAYYSIDNRLNSPNSVFKPGVYRRLRRWLFHILLADYPYNDRDYGYCYGMSEELGEVNLLYPQLARRELVGKKLTEVKKNELLAGIEALYSKINTHYPDSNKYMVMFFDLMDRYKNKKFVKQLVVQVIAQCRNHGRIVLMKYHPRETEKFSEFSNAFEIDKLIPAEKILYDLQGKNVSVLGNATTTCIVAAKLGYSVISICKLEMPDNTKMHNIMTKMGIHCISDINEIKY